MGPALWEPDMVTPRGSQSADASGRTRQARHAQPLLGWARRRSTSPCGAPTASRRGARRAHRLPARLAPEPDNGRVAVGHLDKPQTFAAAGVAVRDDLHGVQQAIGLTKLAELLGCGGTRQMGSRDMHVRFLGEMRHTIARSSTQYAATIPRRRSSESQHEDQRRGAMIPSDTRIVPEKIA